VKITGKENIPEKEAAILCQNHIHALDPVVFILTAKREINGVGKEELYKIGILKWLAKIFGIYPVKRDGSDINTVKILLKLLKQNKLVFIAPEGTRNGLAKGLKPKNGAVNLAIKTGAPIIPIGIRGSFRAFSKVIINIGKPVYYNEGEVNKEDVDNLTKNLMDEIIRLRDEEI